MQGMAHHKKPEVRNSNIGHNRLRLSVKKIAVTKEIVMPK
jgi:hypothetical protein